jgi:spore maturation protein CgeB
MVYKIIIEGSLTPIYRRIINALASSLERQHHQTITIEPGTASPLEFVRRINALQPDLVVITNLFGVLSVCHAGEEKYLYELLTAPIAFLHYDNPLGPINDWDEIERRLSAWVGMSGRSTHFCIEKNNSADFKKLSIRNAYQINHATEFERVDNNGKYRYDVSFVGHMLPESIFLNSIDPDNILVERVMTAYRKRRERLDYRIEEDAVSFADLSVPSMQPIVDWLTAKQIYRARINGASLFLRGSIISDIADSFDVDVTGGDPSYLNDKISTRQLEHARVHLHMPNKGHQGTDRIYAESRININITSIQFDSAIVNRVMDVAAVGGFLLTDWKDDLREITSVCELISYRTIDELKNKIDYFLSHDAERLEIAAQLHHDVKQKCTYDHTVETILGVVTG